LTVRLSFLATETEQDYQSTDSISQMLTHSLVEAASAAMNLSALAPVV